MLHDREVCLNVAAGVIRFQFEIIPLYLSERNFLPFPGLHSRTYVIAINLKCFDVFNMEHMLRCLKASCVRVVNLIWKLLS